MAWGGDVLTKLGGLLVHVNVLHGADPPAEHDGLDPFAPLPIGELLAEGTGEPCPRLAGGGG